MAVPTLQEQLAAVKAAEAGILPTASTGQIAQDDGATTYQQDLAGVKVAEGRVTNVETTNQTLLNSQYTSVDGAATSTLSTTTSQSTPAATTTVYTAAQVNQNLAAGSDITANAPQDAGASARSDDNTSSTSNSTQQIISSSFNQKIVPQPNILDAYTDYTYGLTWYLLTPKQYTDFQNGGRNAAAWSLLAQSGGASPVGRNQFFTLDYYLDNLNIETLVPLKGAGMAHSATAIDFTVTEPNGLTLINNIYKAVSTMYKAENITDTPNYLMAMYCMVIRFYGYNEAGDLVNPIRGGLNGQINKTDPRAIVEKFYPFIIENLQFRLTSNKIEYHVKGKPQGQYTALSQDRGSIPFQFQLAGETVTDVLVGKPVGTQYAAVDPGARTTTPEPVTSPPAPPTTVGDLSTQQQAAIATGSDPSLVGTDGVAYGGII